MEAQNGFINYEISSMKYRGILYNSKQQTLKNIE